MSTEASQTAQEAIPVAAEPQANQGLGAEVTTQQPEQRSDDEKPSLRESLQKAIVAKDSATAEPVAAVKKPTEDSKPQESTQAAVIAPPADMTKEEKEIFLKSPPEIQEYLSRRALQVRNYITEVGMKAGEDRRQAEAIKQLIAPHETRLKIQGVKLDDVVARSLDWDEAFTKNKLEAAKLFLESYDIEPEWLLEEGQQVPPGQAQQSQQFVDPQVQTLQQRLDAIEQSQVEERENAVRFVKENTVQQFMNSKPLFTDPGTAARVEAAMAPFVNALKQQNPNQADWDILEKAYAAAVAAEPDLKQVLDSANRRAEIERQRQRSQQQRKLVGIAGGPNTAGFPQAKGRNIRESLILSMRGELN